MLKNLSTIILVVLLSACSRENIPFSSGALTGQPTEHPASWVEVASAEIIQLETKGDEPYSVNLWVIGKQDWMYIYAGDNYSTWAEHLESNPMARLEVEGKLYGVQATRVTDQAEFEKFAEDWDAKYGSTNPQGLNVSDVWLFRLAAN
ncbi:MAG: hypothetical protein ACJAX5_001237 [Patiriisocius sp.]|jgi:hypothetical protein